MFYDQRTTEVKIVDLHSSGSFKSDELCAVVHAEVSIHSNSSSISRANTVSNEEGKNRNHYKYRYTYYIDRKDI